jgi:hypothetical protein
LSTPYLPSQDRVVRYGIRVRDDGAVAWWSHVHGVFYSPMRFKSFPFDKWVGHTATTFPQCTFWAEPAFRLRFCNRPVTQAHFVCHVLVCRQYLAMQLQYGNKFPESPVNIVPSCASRPYSSTKTPAALQKASSALASSHAFPLTLLHVATLPTPDDLQRPASSCTRHGQVGLWVTLPQRCSNKYLIMSQA